MNFAGNFKSGTRLGRVPLFWCAEHIRQLGGASPLPNQMKVKCSEDGEAETEPAERRALVAMTRTSGPQGLNLLNRPTPTRMSGGGEGASRWLLSLSRLRISRKVCAPTVQCAVPFAAARGLFAR